MFYSEWNICIAATARAIWAWEQGTTTSLVISFKRVDNPSTSFTIWVGFILDSLRKLAICTGRLCCHFTIFISITCVLCTNMGPVWNMWNAKHCSSIPGAEACKSWGPPSRKISADRKPRNVFIVVVVRLLSVTILHRCSFESLHVV